MNKRISLSFFIIALAIIGQATPVLHFLPPPKAIGGNPMEGPHCVSMMFDGDPGTEYISDIAGWNGNPTHTQGVYSDVDFEKSVKIGGIKFIQSQDRDRWITEYILSFSQERGTFVWENETTVQADFFPDDYPESPVSFVAFPSHEGRYLRCKPSSVYHWIKEKEYYGGAEMSFWETPPAELFRELPPPVILDGSPACWRQPTHADGEMGSANLFDGDTNTVYASMQAGNNTFLTFDFGKSRKIEGYEMVQRPGGAIVLVTTLDLSDTQDFSVIKRQICIWHNSERESKTTTFFPGVTARYLRWRVRRHQGKDTSLGASEMKFFSRRVSGSILTLR